MKVSVEIVNDDENVVWTGYITTACAPMVGDVIYLDKGPAASAGEAAVVESRGMLVNKHEDETLSLHLDIKLLW